MCAGGRSEVSLGRGEEEEAQESSKQPLPSLTPYRKPADRTAALRSSWSHPASVRHAQQTSARPSRLQIGPLMFR